jgi:5-methylcytosine-specific restriction endonuclease McrA
MVEGKCAICGRLGYMHIHHIFEGSLRKRSERYGMIVKLCPYCHIGDNGVHLNEKKNRALKRAAQAKFEKTHSREDFIKLFGRSYL